LPSRTTRWKWTARIASCSRRCSGVMVRASAMKPAHMVEHTCMFQVSAVAPQWRPISAATIT
jgi:hypothetical protein